MPFALNASMMHVSTMHVSTMHVSPTKTPEYLAAGPPVVSTPVRDVVAQYAAIGAVQIANDPQAFALAPGRPLAMPPGWRDHADHVRAGISWAGIWLRMAALKAVPAGVYDVLIVGAGFAGAMLAERLAADAGQRVLLIGRHFLDEHQVMPAAGDRRMFGRMLGHANISVRLLCEYDDVDPATYRSLIYTGPVDAYLSYRHDTLPCRPLRFKYMTVGQAQVQDVAVINYPDPAVPHARITEFRHLTGQGHPHTGLCTEYPAAEGDPCHPVPRPENAALYRKHQALADATPDVTFVGRLATHKYYNMDQVGAQALATCDRLMAPRPVLDAAD